MPDEVEESSGAPKEDGADGPRRARRRGAVGHVFRWRKGLWRGILMVGRRLDGKPDYRYVYAKTRAECRRALDALPEQVVQGLPVHPRARTANAVTLGEARPGVQWTAGARGRAAGGGGRWRVAAVTELHDHRGPGCHTGPAAAVSSLGRRQ